MKKLSKKSGWLHNGKRRKIAGLLSLLQTCNARDLVYAGIADKRKIKFSRDRAKRLIRTLDSFKKFRKIFQAKKNKICRCYKFRKNHWWIRTASSRCTDWRMVSAKILKRSFPVHCRIAECSAEWIYWLKRITLSESNHVMIFRSNEGRFVQKALPAYLQTHHPWSFAIPLIKQNGNFEKLGIRDKLI